jgi:putative alpha-1,2-mannosidase
MAEKCAVHRYKFNNEGGRISVDFSNDGLYFPLKAYSEHSELEIISETQAAASVIMQGVRLYFFVECRGAKASALWKNNKDLSDKRKAIERTKESFGCVFEIEGKEAEIRISVSTKSSQMAEDFVLKEKRSFDEIKIQAYSKWNDALSKIEIQSENKDDYEIFYSNLYHSLVKPCDWSGESFIDNSDGDFCVDFCTLWDIYKTQLPLVFSLYPDISSKIINTFVKLCDALGYLPNSFVLTNNFSIESKQACMLTEHIFADAYLRNVHCDYGTVLDTVMKDIHYEYYESFRNNGTLEKTTKVMDISEACRSIALIAHELGREDTARELEELYNKRANVFDSKTGLLKANYDYYEGNLWNYSFRPMHDMEKRMAFCGGKENFIKLLDRFFGFTQPEDKSARFEGFNNETDMETPYAYHYAGRHDRISEIIDSMYKYSFTKGRGGIPGTNDSGGLSSCYVWNTVGIFPVSGKDLMIIGLPCFNKAVMHLSSGKDFCVEKHGRGIYIKEAYLNGKRLSDLSFSVRDMMNGGKLEITVSEKPA